MIAYHVQLHKSSYVYALIEVGGEVKRSQNIYPALVLSLSY